MEEEGIEDDEYENITYEDLLGGKKIYSYKKRVYESVFLLCKYLIDRYEGRDVDKRVLQVTEEVVTNFIALGMSLLRDFGYYYREDIEFLKRLREINKSYIEICRSLGFDVYPFEMIDESIENMVEGN